MSDEPFVSVVIPVHNGGDQLSDQLDALTRQQPSVDWEVVVVDNRSTDGTAERASRYADRLPLRVVSADDRAGASYARNVGSKAARGTYIAYCDADDVVTDTWLEELCRSAVPDAILGGAHDTTQLNSPAAMATRGAYREAKLQGGPNDLFSYAGAANLLIPAALLSRLGGWDEAMLALEDIDLSWRAQLLGFPVHFCGTAVVRYRFRPDSWSAYRQAFTYNRWRVELTRRYGPYGLAARRTVEVFGRWGWLIAHVPFLVMSDAKRYLWFTVLGAELGHLRGVLSRPIVPPLQLSDVVRTHDL